MNLRANRNNSEFGLKLLVVSSKFLAYLHIFLDSELRTKYRTHAIFFLTRATGYMISIFNLCQSLKDLSIARILFSVGSIIALISVRKIKKINFLIALMVLALNLLQTLGTS